VLKFAQSVIGLLLLSGFAANAQTPQVLDVSDVVAGTQRLETRYALAIGKWSDAGKDVAILSTEIHCYKKFGFCEVANALPMSGQATVSLSTFDILRWDEREIVAMDNSPICIVNMLRFDLAAKKVTLSSSSKGLEAQNKICKNVAASTGTTSFLTGLDDEHKRINAEAMERKRKK
jgi:hypothetical protein